VGGRDRPGTDARSGNASEVSTSTVVPFFQKRPTHFKQNRRIDPGRHQTGLLPVRLQAAKTIRSLNVQPVMVQIMYEMPPGSSTLLWIEAVET
jgi:hypothetical protein